MKNQLIKNEVKCINDCLVLAQVSINRKNMRHAKIMLEDALKSINEIERLRSDETIVLVGTRVLGRNIGDS